jgi:hypothetical protein
MLNRARPVFIDETASSTNMVRLRGRCPRGEPLIGAPFVIDGAMNGSTFRTYVEGAWRRHCIAGTKSVP